MDLGAFSVSLSVKDLAASQDFYRKLGFEAMGGNAEHGYMILKNGDHIIGLFQGMFEGNILTFNPGWNQNAENVDEFMDVRDIQNQLQADGIELTTSADSETTGPASITLMDPDGNAILIDQHR